MPSPDSSTTSTIPLSPSTPISSVGSPTVGAPFSIHTGRQGPIGGHGGDQPGVRPSRLVRNQRSCCSRSIGTRQRGRGRRIASSGARARQRISSSWLPFNSTATRCATNMLSLPSRGLPSSQTSARVAMPSNPSVAAPLSTRCRRHQKSSASSVRGSSQVHWPASRRALAAVPGTEAGCQFQSCRRSGVEPAAAVANCQPSRSSTRGVQATLRIPLMRLPRSTRIWRR